MIYFPLCDENYRYRGEQTALIQSVCVCVCVCVCFMNILFEIQLCFRHLGRQHKTIACHYERCYHSPPTHRKHEYILSEIALKAVHCGAFRGSRT